LIGLDYLDTLLCKLNVTVKAIDKSIREDFPPEFHSTSTSIANFENGEICRILIVRKKSAVGAFIMVIRNLVCV
jgi:hypothetical protein